MSGGQGETVIDHRDTSEENTGFNENSSMSSSCEMILEFELQRQLFESNNKKLKKLNAMEKVKRRTAGRQIRAWWTNNMNI